MKNAQFNRKEIHPYSNRVVLKSQKNCIIPLKRKFVEMCDAETSWKSNDIDQFPKIFQLWLEYADETKRIIGS